MRNYATISHCQGTMFSTSYLHGWIPEWPKGTDCKSAANCFGGSNPPPSSAYRRNVGIFRSVCGFVMRTLYCVGWCGGLGRRKGLKIPRWQHRAGSSPATSIVMNWNPQIQLVAVVGSFSLSKIPIIALAEVLCHKVRADQLSSWIEVNIFRIFCTVTFSTNPSLLSLFLLNPKQQFP